LTLGGDDVSGAVSAAVFLSIRFFMKYPPALIATKAGRLTRLAMAAAPTPKIAPPGPPIPRVDFASFEPAKAPTILPIISISLLQDQLAGAFPVPEFFVGAAE
jgi:hypothetical protein